MSPKTATRLSREVVADRAVALADAEGLEAVTVRRLATELGVTPMALYWHFRTKEDLLAGLGDRVLDGLVVPERSGDWATDLRAAMVALVTAMRPHPQLADLVAQQTLLHPAGCDLTELALGALARGGFGPEPAGYLALMAMKSAIALVTGDQVDGSGMTTDERAEKLRYKTAMIRSLDPERYPALTSHADAMVYCADVDQFFDLGIDHYVAGVVGLARR